MTCSFPLRTAPSYFMCYFHLYPNGQNWVAWSYLAAREAKNVIFVLGSYVFILSLMDIFVKEEETPVFSTTTTLVY